MPPRFPPLLLYFSESPPVGYCAVTISPKREMTNKKRRKEETSSQVFCTVGRTGKNVFFYAAVVESRPSVFKIREMVFLKQIKCWLLFFVRWGFGGALGEREHGRKISLSLSLALSLSLQTPAPKPSCRSLLPLGERRELYQSRGEQSKTACDSSKRTRIKNVSKPFRVRRARGRRRLW